MRQACHSGCQAKARQADAASALFISYELVFYPIALAGVE